ncbi:MULTISPECIES: thiol reductant ABC exporter subunit CydD [Nocardiopsis]|uniref:Thiol reductant ABC exporter subunit CydD n=1 Tax=Nocardiopsis sinuspersici TaxID=501010 RepID=A0A1V3BVK9_9ACTN|nr:MULTISPECIES: thiol reductant ABC exporter subunit CydD [Nocardiopsis]OOC52571.1 thiol reductant ABC exporter subunit CydD [Nocardiopsis sinuspersici]
MKPLDPRLVRTADAVRTHLAVSVACGVLVTGLILAQAWLLARAISGAWRGEGLDTLGWVIGSVAAIAVARALLSYLAETSALHSAARTKSQLRRRLVAHVTGSGRVWTAGPGSDTDQGSPRAGELVTLATRGLDALDDYFARYLPQLVLAAIVPLAVLAVVFWADWISGAVVLVTLPLIPVFMALIGMHTRQRTERQWRLLSRLGGHFLDVVEGLPTLAVFRRAKAQAALLREVGEEHRLATMGTLRIAFLSAFALELLSTLAVALVAVEVGLRLLGGYMDYQTALLVLILAPEAYLPLREVGARFHASMEGVAAAEQVFAELDRGRGVPVRRDGAAGGAAVDTADGAVGKAAGEAPAAAPPPATGRPAPAAGGDIRFEGVELLYPGRDVPALSGLDLEVAAGEHLLLTGPSGAGKSTLLSLLLRLTEPTRGRISVRAPGGRWEPLEAASAHDWRLGTAWVPQNPYLFDVSVADNIRLGAPEASMERVREAARLAEADAFVSALPDGYHTRLGERGARLSAGQRQRIALARAMCRDAPLVLLDEPTAHLDPENAAAVRTAVARLLRGRTAVIVAHDTGWAREAFGGTLRTVSLPLPTQEGSVSR